MNYGKVAYEGYLAQAGGKSLVSGVKLPGYGDLPDEIQDAWQAAGAAARGDAVDAGELAVILSAEADELERDDTDASVSQSLAASYRRLASKLGSVRAV